MRDFNKVSPEIWQSQRFWDLPSDLLRVLFLYLLTNVHTLSTGCYPLPPGYAATDLRWTEEEYLQGRLALKDLGLIEFDASTDEVMILRWFKHNPPTNGSHKRGTERIALKIRSPKLRAAVLECLSEFDNNWPRSTDGGARELLHTRHMLRLNGR